MSGGPTRRSSGRRDARALAGNEECASPSNCSVRASQPYPETPDQRLRVQLKAALREEDFGKVATIAKKLKKRNEQPIEGVAVVDPPATLSMAGHNNHNALEWGTSVETAIPVDDYDVQTTNDSDEDSYSSEDEYDPLPHLPLPLPLSVSTDEHISAVLRMTESVPELAQQCRFDRAKFVGHVITELKQQQSCGEIRHVIAGGRTQSQKTAFKTVMSLCCHQLGMSCAIVTDTIPNRNSLTQKIVDMQGLLHCPEDRPCVMNIAAGGRGGREEELLRCLKTAGTIVLSFTVYQLGKMRRLITQVRGLNSNLGQQFVLCVDEADAADRTRDQRQQGEQALQLLRGAMQQEGCRFEGPRLELSVSATLLPVLFRVLDRRIDFSHDALFFTQPGDQYSGFENMRPLQSVGGRDVFLSCGELTKKNQHYTESVKTLYGDAAMKPRALLLDISNPAVSAHGNVYQKAERVRCDFPNLAFVVRVGARQGHSGISVLYPEATDWENIPKGHSVSDVLEMLDSDVRVGLETPVAVLGYTMMMRGDSFRSHRRVPTHILNSLGQTMSIEKYLQSMGRATFQGLRVLQENRFEHVTVLTPPNDFDVCTAYCRFLDELRDKLRAGFTLEECLTSEEVYYSFDSNFSFRNNRSIGQPKLGWQLQAQFNQRPLGQPKLCGEAWTDAAVAADGELALMAEDLGRISDLNSNAPMTPQEYVEHLDRDQGADTEAITLKAVSAKLLQLQRMGMFQRVKVNQMCGRKYVFGYFKRASSARQALGF